MWSPGFSGAGVPSTPGGRRIRQTAAATRSHSAATPAATRSTGSEKSSELEEDASPGTAHVRACFPVDRPSRVRCALPSPEELAAARAPGAEVIDISELLRKSVEQSTRERGRGKEKGKAAARKSRPKETAKA